MSDLAICSTKTRHFSFFAFLGLAHANSYQLMLLVGAPDVDSNWQLHVELREQESEL
jgi:hypothetical protein